MQDRIANSQFSDDSIRRFLLGQLQASEQSVFEEQLFTNSELEARVRLAEFELADDYARKRLTQNETESFHEKYLLTVDRNRKLDVSQAIRDRFMSTAEPEPAVYRRLMTLFDVRHPAWRYAFAVLILALILATVFLVTTEPQIAKRFIPARFRSKPQPTATPQMMNHSTAPSSPIHAEQSPPATPHESPLIVSLIPTSSLDQSPVIAQPVSENVVVRFQLSVAAGVGGVYRADLMTMSGETLFSAESLKPYGAQASIDVDVPASTLKSGQYQIRLSGTNNQTKQENYQYYFRVQ